MSRRILAIGMMSALISIGLLGFGISGQADTVTFGIVAEISGGGAPVGKNWERGVHLAVEEINQAGGILERRSRPLPWTLKVKRQFRWQPSRRQ